MNIEEYKKLQAERHRRERHRDEEHHLQAVCVRWFRVRYPKLRHALFAIPNGGRRDAVTGARLKAEGVLAGVSDLVLLKSNRRYGALLIEMKTPRGVQSTAQKQWQQAVTAGCEYKYVVCRTPQDFIKEVDGYLADI